MSAIAAINELALAAPHVGAAEAGGSAAKDPGGVSFEGMLRGMVDSANQATVAADQAAQQFAAGRSDDIHGTMIAIKRADIELHLVSTVRSKLVDAFNDLWRMNV